MGLQCSTQFVKAKKDVFFLFKIVSEKEILNGNYSVDYLEMIHSNYKRVWIDSIKWYESTQDVIDGPHCTYVYMLNIVCNIFFVSS